ncbi:hypothetical protein [Paucibacter soli]|uniref:hypothetical protein n=1 Tax=Paucibacter soli TaxID=3133433 RepID=UPI0030B4F847
MSAAILMRRCLQGLIICSAALLLAACGGGGESQDLTLTKPQATQARIQSVAAASATVVSLTKVGETRVGRTLYDYVFKITVLNGAQAQKALTAKLVGSGAGTTVLDGDVNVGDIAAHASVTPADTITLRQDRLLPLLPAQLLWQFAAAPPAAAPASIALELSQLVAGAGTAVAIMPTVLDTDGKAMNPLPPINYQVLRPAEGAEGATPAVAGAQLQSAADTRGGFTLVATVDGTAISAQQPFTVIAPTPVSKNSGLYANLSAAQGNMARQLQLLKAALDRGDNSGAAAAKDAITAAAASVDPVRLHFSTPYQPASGFVPLPAKLAANGYAQTPGDLAHGAASAQLRAKLQQITALLKQSGGSDAANTALLDQYRGELQTLAAQLAGAQPSLYGLVDKADLIQGLIATEMPALLKAMAERTNAQLAPQALLGAVPSAKALSLDRLLGKPGALQAWPSAAGQAKPQFLLGGMLNALGPIGQLVNKIYGDYLNQLQNMTAILAAKGLLDKFLPGTAFIDGIHSGAAVLGPYAYNYPDSSIEVSGMDLAVAQAADVYLIGGAAINALGGLASALPPPKPASIKEVYDYFDGLISAINAVGEAYDLAHQQPAQVAYNSFSENSGCLATFSDFCMEFQYPNGFKNVSGGNVSFTVLILIRAGGARPQHGSGVFNFAPGT